ncbi:MAG: hypothetical protein FWG40_04255 [Peptococcaceae bacterium]|nr:hypothetical protein [Peptococcaceae bacterium]
MSKQQERRDKAIKKAKRQRMIIIASVAAVALVIITLGIYSAIQSAGTERYSDGNQVITLRQDGTFTATLIHGDKYKGTYTKTEQDNKTIVAFTSDEETVNGEIDGSNLRLPSEWVDDHGHGDILKKR